MGELVRVMLDLETMGNGCRAAIVQIGACASDGREPFLRTVDLQSSIDAGMEVDGKTVMWWLQQSAEARASVAAYPQKLSAALLDFTWWLGGYRVPDIRDVECELWAYPAQFDVTVLGEAYRLCGWDPPWHYRAPRCLRTLARLHPSVPKAVATVQHDALQDAVAQMRWLDAMLARQSELERPKLICEEDVLW